LEDIEKKSEDTGKKKKNRGKDNAIQEDTEAWKCITPSEWRKKNQGTVCRSHPLGYATYGTAGGKCIVVPSGSEGNRKQK